MTSPLEGSLLLPALPPPISWWPPAPGWIALALLPFLILVALSPFLMRGRVDRLGSEAREAAGELGAFAVDSVQGLGEIVAFQQEAARGAKLDALSDHHVNIVACSTHTGNDRVAKMRFEFELGDHRSLDAVLRTIKGIDGVYDAYRLVPGHAG